MQKKLIALAVAGLASSAAFAQSNVTIYGVVDLGQAWVKSSGGAGADQGNVGRLDSNSSYIGFKGVEDLGNGLKAVFQYETGFTADDAGGLAGARDTFVGLTGGFGTFVAGNLTSPTRAMGAKVELTPGAAGFGTVASVTGTILGTKTGVDNRSNNALAYISPSFSGFTGTIAYVNGETHNAAGANARQWQVAGQYENGPIYAGLAYHRSEDYAAATTLDVGNGTLTAPAVGVADGGQATVWRLAGAYTFPTNTKVTALYDRTKIDTAVTIINPALGTVGTEAKRTAWSLGVAQGFGNHTVGLEYARAGKTKVGGDSLEDSGYNMYTAVYSYALSKRTMVHARYSKLNNDDLVNTNFYNNPVTAASSGEGGSAGSNYSGFMVGLRHTF